MSELSQPEAENREPANEGVATKEEMDLRDITILREETSPEIGAGPTVELALESISFVTKRVLNARRRFHTRKRKRKEIAVATLFEGLDSRLYARIEVNNQTVEGLLDSEGTVTCLDKYCLQFVDKAQLAVHHFQSKI